MSDGPDGVAAGEASLPGTVATDEPPATGLLTTFNARLARAAMILAVCGLIAIVVIVGYQVFGRYVLNSSPTWTENLALVLVLYVTLVGAAVGVRDAGHIGLESLLVLAPRAWRRRLEAAIHGLVLAFGACMVYNGWLLGSSVVSYRIPNLGLPEVVRYVPLVVSGLMIVGFCIEHLLALSRGQRVVPSWH